MSLLDLFKKKESHKKVAIIGLDGVSYGLIKDLSTKGQMPNLTGLIQEGIACEMETSIPPVSSVTWATFITGVNPAKHGIFGLMDRRRGSYGIYFPDSLQIHSPTLWDLLTDKGKKTVAINIPQTYPAREMNGIIISGFVALNLEKAVYPEKLVPALKEIDYRIDIDYQNATERKDEFFNELFYLLEMRRETFLNLMKRIHWDLFIGVFTCTNRLNHFFWRDYENPTSHYHQRFLSFYRQIDAIIGEMVEELDEETALLIISDHGFDHLKKEVYLNAWLKKEGLLKLKDTASASFEDIDPDNTKAFVLEPSRVYVNLQGVMPQGCVDPGAEYEQLIRLLNEGFLSLKDESTSELVISRVCHKKELFFGPFIDRAPDLILWGTKGYDIKGSITQDEIFGQSNSTGKVTHNDAFFYMKGLETLPSKPHLKDIAPTILKLLNLPIPQDMDGNPIV
jgi:predicted AlkP superfamily phosphohydrolase/phosphomutase